LLAVSKRGSDDLEHTIGVGENVIIPKAQDSVSVLCQPAVAYGIAWVGRMLTTVDLYYEATFAAHEVDDIGSDRLLADKLVASDLTGTKPVPKLTLGVGRIAT
jgi:hypothetical protein